MFIRIYVHTYIHMTSHACLVTIINCNVINLKIWYIIFNNRIDKQ